MFFFKSALALLAVGSAVAAPLDARQAAPPMAPTRIFKCTVPGTIALTFDDGPHLYTEEAVKLLDAAGMKGTFFLNGQNWGSISNYGPLLKTMQKGRHQLASHTWSHANLAVRDDGSIPSRDAVKKEMVDLEVELRRLTGYWSNWMRAPYTAYTPRVTDVLKYMQYYIVDYDIDTKDYEESGNPNANYDVSFKKFVDGLNAGGSIVLAHDVHPGTVRKLLPRMIAEIKKRGLKAVTVGECTGVAYSGWYKVTPRA